MPARRATSAAASYTTNWEGEGDGAEIWKDFSADGELADQPIQELNHLAIPPLPWRGPAPVDPREERTLA